ncbi:hypothetical protein DPP16_12785 [Salmonella enterica subsp. salamae serovar Sofia]|nr:hypothetical protein [Salmonella enterica subsp. salamae serovar Sofia]
MPISTLQPGGLEALVDDDKDDDAEDGEDNVDGGEDGAGSGRGDDSGDSGENDDSDDNEKKKYHLRFVLKDDEQKSYSQTDYIAFLPEGTQLTGKTDEYGYTEIFCLDKPDGIYIDILLDNNQWEIR